MPTATTFSASEFVTLRGGLVVPLPLLQFVWQLENRGIRLTSAVDGSLLVHPASRLTDSDRTTIREHKPELMRLTAYCEGVVQ